MEFLKRSWGQVQGFFGQLGPTERWLIGALLIILVFVGTVVVQYAGDSETEPLSGFTGERAAIVVGKLQERGIEAKIDGGQVHVPRDKWAEALVVLDQSDLLSTDLVSAFDDMINRQSVWSSNSQRDREFLVAKQKVLAAVMAHMKNVKNAVVVLDMPKHDRFARPQHPSASVSLNMEGRHTVDRAMVESVAGLVSGAVVDMKPQDVIVIDSNAGRRFTVKDAIDELPEEAWQMVRKLEVHHRQKIHDMLSYIPGVIVAVSVRTDPITRKVVKTREYAKSEPLKKQVDEETENTTSRPTGRTGARANTESEIGPAGGDSTVSKTTRSEVEFGEKALTMESDHVEAGHTLQQVNVTVNVPRSYFVSMLKQQTPDKEPDAAALEQAATEQLKEIAAQVEPHINTAEVNGIVRTHMINDSIAREAVTANAAPSTGMLAVLESDWVRPAGLTALALGALALMFGMVKKATVEADMPTAEELAGIPPTLPSDEELIGEADASDTTMSGVELDDDELHHRKIAEQIGEMINANPTEAASLFGKWVRVND